MKKKLKTLRAALKRFTITGNKKIFHYKVGKNHLLSKKNKKRKRHLSAKVIINEYINKAQINKLLPYI
ncbi:ribosomal protein L35 (chloroplast) [Galdieria partita]|uniref:Large ribosomal subunit protein bL35c n=1 Tax=Galdieria partita TaxID=83374 RepID=A0A9C7EXY4_9RHOD|nr:ribosomal protein L35 [Galdieria partita]